MRRVVIFTNSDIADGFRLAGVETLEGHDNDAVGNKAKLLSLVNDDDVGIIGISEAYFSELDEPTRAKIEKLERPIIVSIPATRHLEVSEGRHAYLAKMIRRAIGFDIKIGGEA